MRRLQSSHIALLASLGVFAMSGSPLLAQAWGSDINENDGVVIEADNDGANPGVESFAVVVSDGPYSSGTDPSAAAQLEIFGSAIYLNENTTLTGSFTLSGNIVDSNGSVVVDDGFQVTGNTDLGGSLDLAGDLFDSGGSVTINDSVVITGAISDSDSALTLDDSVNITGSLFDGDSALVIDDTLQVTGSVDAQDGIFDSTGDLLLDDAVDITGNLDAQGTISDSTGDLTLDDAVDITGALDAQAGISDSTGDLLLDDAVDITGNLDAQGTISDSTGDLTLDDAVDITGALDAQAGISDSTGDLLLDDAVDITGNLDAQGTISDSTGDLTLDDDVDVTGTLTVTDDTTLNGDTNQIGTASSENTLTGTDNTINSSDTTTITGDVATIVKGGTNSGTLTLQDGDAAGGTSIAISGSVSGTAATVFQTTTDDASDNVATLVGTSDAGKTSDVTIQAGTSNILVHSTATGAGDVVEINGNTLLTGTFESTGNSDIGTDDDTTNTFGSGDDTTNTIGSATFGTTVTSIAASSSSTLAAGSAVSGVVADTGNGIGVSNLGGATEDVSGQVGVVLAGADTVSPQIDANGQLSFGAAVAGESTASLTLTNGYGYTHGIVVTEDKVTISGGTQSTSMTLDDYGVTFTDAATGDPVTVTGVADGIADFDAVNRRQLNMAFAGIAGVAAMTNLPNPQPGDTTSLGFAFGGFEGESAFAVGLKSMIGNSTISGSFAYTSQQGTVVGLGAGWSW